MMIRNDLHVRRTDFAGKGGNLRSIQIVRRRQTVQPQIEERARTENVRSIEAEVANPWKTVFGAWRLP